MIPFYLCVVLVGIQALFDSQVNKSLDNQCGCKCIHKTGDEKCQMVCGVEYSTRDQGVFCAIPNPQPWPSSFGSYSASSATTYKGSATNYLDAGIVSDRFIYNLQPRCTQKSNFSFSVGQPPLNFTKEILFKWIDYVLILRKQEIRCVQGLNLWRNSSREVNSEIFRGYQKGNPEGKINEIVAAYDLLDTNKTNFNVNIWYNATYLEDSGNRPPKLLRVPRLVSLVILTTLVYEKQQRLRIIMKMHGLGDGPYWMISYAYCLDISTVCVICLMIFGSAIAIVPCRA
uniref:Uncharacterized protein n=1 Tax=Brassica oleracea var. oleracea TaxID=109376 RepID=A0A0D3A903_BRAOL